MYRNFFKPLIDFLIALVILLMALVPLLVIAMLILAESKGPLFFKQERVGKDLRLFQVFKFRTMTHEKRTVGNTPIIGKAEGVTKVGYYLRRYKIDELPQLLNVLFGDMSLIGPRPSVPEQLKQMTEAEKQRYSVRPGLTGLAQINGNIHLSWKERFVYDLNYVKKVSFWNDLKIIFKTVFIVILGEQKFLNKPLTDEK
ncbi:sugar transferase [Flavobacterium sp. CYK-4]|uniref:sugar transferase n=1 Tax=Flavobacterium lotistagni TaxID=2709660 RepID=UPI00140738B4|nr:sugar transferase [Flavobacterium lotistagni]NHM06427.1 sugar transferase [Flavobacterium lotistagni]